MMFASCLRRPGKSDQGRRKPRSFVPSLESLAERLAPAVASTTFLNGVLTIQCNNADDVVRLRQDPRGNILLNGAPARDARVDNTMDIRIFGRGGHDLLEVDLPLYFGKDHLDGSDGNDTLVGGNGRSTLLSGPNADDMTGGGGDDSFVGGTGSNRLIESANTNMTLTDTQMTGLGTDQLQDISTAQLTGGSGGHRYVTTGFTGSVFIDGGGGVDLILTGPGDDTLFGGAGTDKDIIYGGGGNDQVWGQGGNDWLNGNAGSDILYGGAGDDTLVGETGEDTMDGGDDYDTLREKGESIWIDNQQLQIAWHLPDDHEIVVEWDTHTGIEAAHLSGYADLTNGIRIDGSHFSGPLTLDGGDYNDTLIGGSGRDTIDGFLGDDLILGNGADDRLLGNEGRDLLVGGSGADELEGGAGEDILIAGATVWDANAGGPLELVELHNEWRRTDLDYENRWLSLYNGVGPNKSAHLNPSDWGSTLLDDGVVDVLTGGDDADLFFWRDNEDDAPDRDDSELWPGA
jgi:Ca2+-binding RTX toxin-like protein